MLPALNDEADGGEAHGHEVGDGENHAGRHELGEGGRVGPVHRLLKLQRQACRTVVCRYITHLIVNTYLRTAVQMCTFFK